MIKNKVIELLDNPEELEELYREDSDKFSSWILEALQEYPDSETLKVWQARLNYTPKSPHTPDHYKLLTVIYIAIFSGFLVKLPSFFPISGEWYYPRFAPLIVLTSLITYFLFFSNTALKQKRFLFAGLAACMICMIMLPDKETSSSITMSIIHLPLILLSILGLSFMSSDWRSPDARLRYIRYIGEIIIYSSLLMLGGVVLTLLTFGLFSLIDVSISEWYMQYVVVIGLVSCPIVATYLYDSKLNRESKLATFIANIFAPLFLITVLVYLLAMLYGQKSPYSDRDFFITFNGLLVVVWGITVYSISGKTSNIVGKLTDNINISLITVTLIVNSIALSAILYRLIEYGVTPNRVVVIGANVLIFIHLVRILVNYVSHIKNNTHPHKLTDTVANYLPIYSGWAIFVVAFLPIIFWFE